MVNRLKLRKRCVNLSTRSMKPQKYYRQPNTPSIIPRNTLYTGTDSQYGYEIDICNADIRAAYEHLL